MRNGHCAALAQQFHCPKELRPSENSLHYSRTRLAVWRCPSSRESVKKKAKSDSSVAPFSLRNIAELIEDGEITIGRLRPIGCVATAADEDCTYAMLVRHRGETLLQFLIRLDQALTLGIFTDEINP